MEEIQNKYVTEKEKAIKDFDSYKVKVADMAQRTNRDYQEKFESQDAAITKMNFNFQEKIATFETLNLELKTSLQTIKVSKAIGIDDLKKDFEKETNELIRRNDESYKEMLKEQLKIQGTKCDSQSLYFAATYVRPELISYIKKSHSCRGQWIILSSIMKLQHNFSQFFVTH